MATAVSFKMAADNFRTSMDAKDSFRMAATDLEWPQQIASKWLWIASEQDSGAFLWISKSAGTEIWLLRIYCANRLLIEKVPDTSVMSSNFYQHFQRNRRTQSKHKLPNEFQN